MNLVSNARGIVCLRVVCWLVLGAGLSPGQDAGTATPAPDPNSPQAPIIERDKQVSEFDPLAQDPEAEVKAKAEQEAARQAEKRRQQVDPPIPGSIADSQIPDVPRAGPAIEGEDSESNLHDYSGPAVLTRSYSLGMPTVPKLLRWTESVSVATEYDSGIAQAGPRIGQTGPNGQTVTSGTVPSGTSLGGTNLSWTFGGGHAFAHDQVGFSTGGSTSYYPGSGFYTGSNAALTVFWSHIISRRISTNTTISGSILSANSALANLNAGPGTIANVNFASSPDISVLDNGSKQGTISSGLTWGITNRLQASVNGSYFGVIRDSPVLYGMSGTSEGGSLTYRFTRKLTMGGNYGFSTYVYPHGTQDSVTQSVGLILSYALNRSTQIRFNGGVSRTETLGLQVVPIDPLIALILGQSTGIIDAYQKYSGTQISAQVVHDFHRSHTVSFSYVRGITPGNGLFQTSMIQTAMVSTSLKFLRTYTLSFNGGWNKTASIGFGLPAYESEYASVSTGRKLARGMNATFSLNWRHFDSVQLAQLRNQISVSSGISWGNQNGRLWPF